MDADFLAIYRIDLETTDVGAKRFLQLANRLPAYQGVIANAMAAEQHAEQAPEGGGPEQPQEVSIDAMNLMIPGLIERVEV